MAVAVKNNPEARTGPSPFDRMQVVALVGVVYTLASLAIIFNVIPLVWQAFWSGLLHFQGDSFASYTLQGLLMLAGAAGLIVLGGRLLGPRAQPGVRSSIFTGILGLLLVVFLTRWYSMWAEHLAFYPQVVPGLGGKEGIQGVGDFLFFLVSVILFLPAVLGGWTGAMIATIVVGLILLAVFLRLFFSRRADRFLIAFDEQGWFSGASFKRNQGMKVRRGTILGILVLFGSGVWTMVSHNTLAGMSDWKLNIPFTSVVSFKVDQLGLREIGTYRDTLKEKHSDWFTADKPAAELIQGLKGLETSLAEARKKDKVLPDLGNDISAARERLEEGNDLRGAEEALALVSTSLKPALLDVKDQNAAAGWFKELQEAVENVQKQAEKTREAASQPITLNRYDLQVLNQKIDPATHELLVDPLHLDEKYAQPVLLDKAEARKIEAERKDKGLSELTASEPSMIYGPETFASITLLPAAKFSLPLLLLALTLWFAWRVVNLPVFADFLIATEGELNKVSWTTRRRLLQDTIVVLVTVVLMAFYLFAMDQVWGRLLSWKPVGVIVLNQQTPEQMNKGTEKPW